MSKCTCDRLNDPIDSMCKSCLEEGKNLGCERMSERHFVCRCQCQDENCLDIYIHLSPCFHCKIENVGTIILSLPVMIAALPVIGFNKLMEYLRRN